MWLRPHATTEPRNRERLDSAVFFCAVIPRYTARPPRLDDGLRVRRGHVHGQRRRSTLTPETNSASSRRSCSSPVMTRSPRSAAEATTVAPTALDPAVLASSSPARSASSGVSASTRPLSSKARWVPRHHSATTAAGMVIEARDSRQARRKVTRLNIGDEHDELDVARNRTSARTEPRARRPARSGDPAGLVRQRRRACRPR